MTADVIDKPIEDSNNIASDSDVAEVKESDSLETLIEEMKNKFESELSKIREDFNKELKKKDTDISDLRAINSALAMGKTSKTVEESPYESDFYDIDFNKVAEQMVRSIDERITKY